jgi:hypothetical protein
MTRSKHHFDMREAPQLGARSEALGSRQFTLRDEC